MAIPILHLCDKFGVAGSSTHGVSRLFSWWFPRFDARFDVTLCGLKSPEPGSRALEAAGIPVHHLARGPFDPRLLFDIVRLVRRRHARVLHVHGYAAADFGRLAARLTGAALVLHEHFADPRMPAYQGLADRLLARFTDAALAVSASTAEFLIHERHVPAERVRVVYNGVPLEEFGALDPTARHALRAELGLSDDDCVVATIGRLSAQKGHRFLLQAAAQVLARRDDVRFLIVGDGELGEPLRRQAAELAILPRVLFTGHRSDVPTLLQAVDVLCISSTYEGTPLVLFEAMAAGKAVVSSAVDGCREIVEHQRTGLLVPVADVGALATALLRVVEDAGLRERLGREARTAAAMHDVQQAVRKIEAVYDEVIERRGRRKESDL